MAPSGSYKRIAEDLRRRIASGEFDFDLMLPSEATLAEEQTVSRGTIRAALALLQDSGLIEVVPGRGRRVVSTTSTSAEVTRWEKVATVLRCRIGSNAHRSGQPLPSETTLMSEFGVSRNTVRRAYRQLLKEGLVVVRPGSGAYSVETSPDHQSASLELRLDS